MQAIKLIFKATFSLLVIAINKIYEFVKAELKTLKDYVNKTASEAKGAAIAAAKQFTETTAVTTEKNANDYTDLKFASLQQLYEMGIKFSRYVAESAEGILPFLPYHTELGFTDKPQFVIVEVEATVEGKTNFGDEHTLNVFTGEFDPKDEKVALHKEIKVSTEDRLFFEIYKRNEDGLFYMKFIRVHQDRMREMYVEIKEETAELRAKIEAQLSEAETMQLIDDSKASILATLHPDLQA